MSGGKGGSNTSSVQIPSWLEDAAKTNLSKADYAGQIGYTPYYGPDVAAQTQNQLLGNQATYDAAAAFGLVPQGGNANAGMPTPTTYAGGVSGYSSGDLYDQAVAELASRRPGQASALNSMFIDPYSGEQNVLFTPGGSVAAPGASSTVNSMVDYGSSDGSLDLSNASTTNTQKIMNALQMNQFAEDYPVLMPGGFVVHGAAGINDWLTQKTVPTYGPGASDGSGGSWSLSPENAAGDSGLTWTGSGGNTFSTNKTYNDTSGLSSTGTWDFTQD